MSSLNVFHAENLEGRIDVARHAGSSATAMFVYDLEPGAASCPYHYEYEEEWLLVVAGTITVRAPEGEYDLVAGDLVRFAPGPAGAHRMMNRGAEAARMLLWSSARTPAVSVYPDSDKIGVWAGDEANDLVFRRGDNVPWEDGEDGWQEAG